MPDEKFFFLDESDSDSADKIIFSATRPDGFSFKAYLIDPCKCVNCSKADPKNEDQQSDFEVITQFSFRESQKYVRRARLDLASAEQSYDYISKLISKRRKTKEFFFLDLFEFEKKKISKYSRKIDISHMRFGVCKKEYWYFDCVDLYIELLILLNCNFIGACRPCTYILKWIISIRKVGHCKICRFGVCSFVGYFTKIFRI